MLRDILDSRRERIHQRWLDLILAEFPPDSQAFLRSERDQFRNPIGHTFRQETAVILSELIGRAPSDATGESLDHIIKIRAVQDCPPSEAAGLFILLKQAIRAELVSEPESGWSRDELSALESEIDRLTLRAFDCYTDCRERIHKAVARAAQMRVAKLLERMSRPHENANAGAALRSGDEL
ncbi:MAG: RsbRD N-terminal domain-containing protein [Candidatus Zixiibacteriota bacterium]